MSRMLCAAALAAVMGGPAMARQMGPLDADRDGFVSLAELQARYPVVTAEIHAAIDASGDGRVDMAEIEAALAEGLLKTGKKG